MKRKLIKKNKKKRGFTLIELLAVILILGIIALIAIPTVTGIVEESRRGAKVQTANQLVKAAEQYLMMCELSGGYDSKGNECVTDIKDAESKGLDINSLLDLKGDTLTYDDINIFKINNNGKLELNYNTDGYTCSNFIDKKGNPAYDMNKAVDLSDKIDCSKDEQYKEKIMYDINTFKMTYIDGVGYLENTKYHSETYADNIIHVYMVYYIDLSKAVESWDMTKDNSGNVMAWVEDIGNNNYDLYIGSEGTIAPTSLFCFFANMTNVVSYDLYNLDTSRTTTFQNLFRVNRNVEKIEFGKIDTSNVTNMYGTFINCNKIEKLDLSGWNARKVTSAGYMFFETNGLKELILGEDFTMESATNLTRLFYKMSSMEKLDLNMMNVSKNKDFYYMFGLNSKLKELDISSWDTSSATDMSRMFYNDKVLENIYVGPNFVVSETSTDYLYQVPAGAIKTKN